MQKQVSGFRLSPQQRRLCLLLQDARPAHAQCAILLEGQLKESILRESLQDVINRHQILRTTFHRSPGIIFPIQVIADSSTPSWRTVRLSTGSPRERAERVEAALREERLKAFGTERGPLLHASLLVLSEREHVLLLSLHALCADVKTLENLVHEISRAYQAHAEGRALTDEPVQYVQFSEWQNELLEDEEAKAGEGYWRQLDLSSAMTLKIPFERRAHGGTPFEPDFIELELDAYLVARIGELASSYDLTPALLMLACWQALLWRLTQEPEIVVGNFFENRKLEELSDALGLFARCVPVHCHFDESATLSEILKRVNESARDADEWQEYFDWDQVASLTGQPGTPPVISFSFEFEQQMAEHYAGGVKFSLYKRYTCGERFKVKLSCVAREGALRVMLHYDSSLFREDDIHRLLKQFQALVKSAVHNPAVPLGHLEILDDEERQRLLVDWNDTWTAFPSEQCLHELFEAQVERTPDATALIFKDVQLSYGELDRKANQLAHYLRGQGVGPEILVGIMMERSPEMMVALLGILKAGGAYLPLDPQYPSERLSFMLEEGRVPVLLTQQRLQTRLGAQETTVLCLDTDWRNIAGHSTAGIKGGAVAENVAYVIYTSGSTGQPKGVMVTHRGLVNYLTWCVSAYKVGNGKGAPVHSSIAFDLTVTSLFSALLAGLSVTLLDESEGIGLLADALRDRSDYSLVKITPAHLELLSRQLTAEEAANCTRALVIGGEALLSESLTFWRTHAAGTRLINEYGPTETVVGCSIYEVGPEEELPVVVPIGRPIANTQMYVLNACLQLTPPEVAGELYVGGEGVARGYLRRAELTAERFIPHPFSSKPGARLYRTGDVARYLPDGNLEFLGRLDQQVKVRGFRIELGEIEAALNRHPALREAVVTVHEDVSGDKRLVAYCVSHPKQSPETRELRAHLCTTLPDYMIPATFIMLEALPLTPNGKVDRKALPASDQSRPGLHERYMVPRTPVEEILAGIWATILGLDRVGVYDNFFELGGHSLLATQLMSRVHDSFQVDVPLRIIFDRPTIAMLAESIEQAIGAEHDTQMQPVRPVSREGGLPLSFAQQRLWFLDQLQPASHVYNVPLAVRLRGPLDLPALRRALHLLAARHEVLRTCFPSAGGRPRQLIRPRASLPLPLLDLGGLPGGEREARALELAAAQARLPFDLARGPLARALALRLGEEEHLLSLTLHHIISDGWSLAVLVREAAALYGEAAGGAAAGLEPLAVQYGDYAAWERGRMGEGGWLAEQLSYWRGQLGGAEPLELPTDYPRPQMQSFHGARELFALPPHVADGLKVLGRQHGVTSFMMLFAAFVTLLYRYTEQEDIVIGTSIANRTRPETEPLLGCFFNQLALRTDLSGNPTFRELLRRVREVTLDAYAHQDVPFEKLLEEIQPERKANQFPLFQIFFGLDHDSLDNIEIPGLTLSVVELPSTVTKFDLILMVNSGARGLSGIFEYNTDLFKASTIKRMAGHFQILLGDVVEHPDKELRSIDITRQEETHHLVHAFNDDLKG